MNRVYLEGYITSAPEVRRPPKLNTKRPQGLTVFNMAVRQKWIGEGKRRVHIHTHYFKIVVWGEKWVESLKSQGIAKGCDILLRGELRSSSWKDRSGKRKYSVEVHVQPYPMGNIEVMTTENAKSPPPEGDGDVCDGDEIEETIPTFSLEDMP